MMSNELEVVARNTDIEMSEWVRSIVYFLQLGCVLKLLIMVIKDIMCITIAYRHI